MDERRMLLARGSFWIATQALVARAALLPPASGTAGRFLFQKKDGPFVGPVTRDANLGIKQADT